VTDRRRKSVGSRYQPVVAALCRDRGWPEPVAELSPIEGRRWRADLAWPQQRLIVEVQGGVWLQRGGHTGGQAQIDDMEKFNALQLHGWRVLQVTPQQVTSGELSALLSVAFE
jgi:hypothetical protein